MIIDVHSHDFADAVVIRAMNGMCRATEGVIWSAADGTLTTHLDFMDLSGIDKAVSCPIATKPQHFDIILRRALAIKDGAFGPRAQQKIIPFASVHPLDPEVDKHLEQIAKAGLKGVKFHPYYQDFSLADPACWPMFHKIAELGLVVQCHSGGDVAWLNTKGLCGPQEIEKLLKNVRGLKFIAAHLGGMYRYPAHEVDRLLECGAYIDTSVIHAVRFQDEAMRLLHSWPTERLLFGTDFPWEVYTESLAWVREFRAPEDWPAVLGGNACRLLSITNG